MVHEFGDIGVLMRGDALDAPDRDVTKLLADVVGSTI
jgi:hypothetical protein